MLAEAWTALGHWRDVRVLGGGLADEPPAVVQLSMNIATDTSAVIAVVANEPERDAIIELTIGASLIAPASLHWEVGNAFAAMLRRRRITLAQAELAVERYQRMLFRFVDVELQQALRLSERLGLYAYDAYVLACAQRMRCPVLTLDRRLAVSAPRAGVQILEVGT